MNVTTSKDVETKEKFNAAIRGGNETYRNLIEDTFHDAGWITPEVLQGMRQSDDFYCSQFGQIRSPRIHNGHVALVGDAGYATPGLGTSLAIIGGYVLAGELLSHPSDVQRALEQYQDIMLPFVKKSQGNVDAMQMLNPQTLRGIRIRNVILSFVTWTKLDRLAMLGASALGFTGRKVTMPDYQWPSQ